MGYISLILLILMSCKTTPEGASSKTDSPNDFSKYSNQFIIEYYKKTPLDPKSFFSQQTLKTLKSRSSEEKRGFFVLHRAPILQKIGNGDSKVKSVLRIEMRNFDKHLKSNSEKEYKSFLSARTRASRIFRKMKTILSTSSKCAINSVTHYGEDSQNIWNKIYASLYIGKRPDGCHFGENGLDPIVFAKTNWNKNRIERILDLLKIVGTQSVESKKPIERAVFQRDLIVALAGLQRIKSPSPGLGLVMKNLTTLIKHLALPAAEIRKFPDNLAMAIDEGFFQTEKIKSLDPVYGNRFQILANKSGLIAPVHARSVKFASAFYTHIALPENHLQTSNYIRKLGDFQEKGRTSSNELNRKTPQFPAGTHLVLQRKMVLLSKEGYPVVSPITTNLQRRVYGSIKAKSSSSPFVSKDKLNYWIKDTDGNFREISEEGNSVASGDDSQDAEKFVFNRAALIQNQGDHFQTIGLRHLGYNTFFGFGGPESSKPSLIRKECTRCHSQPLNGPGIHSVFSYSRFLSTKTDQVAEPKLSGVSTEHSNTENIYRSKELWKLLSK
jgi:hypothetical protein